MLNLVRNLYDPKDLEDVREILFDLDGEVVSLLDNGGNVVQTRDGEEDFFTSRDRIDILVASVGVIVGVDFYPGQVAEPDKCRLWVRR